MSINDSLEKMRAELERAQNPVFLYDNDADGFCSFILLRRWLGRGKGVAVRSHPDLDVRYVKKVQELKADAIVVLDRPLLGESFVSEIEALQLPLIWIDHHNVNSPHYEHPHVKLFNPTREFGREEPTSYWAYELAQRKEDDWIAIMGCVSDHFLPSFAKEFGLRHPELWGKVRKPFDAYYGTELGRLARAIGFGLKDSVTHVVYLQNFMISCLTPESIADELTSQSSFGRKYKEIGEKVEELLIEAHKLAGKKLIFFKYGGTVSVSADLANELCYQNPQSIIAVAYQNGVVNNISLRGKDIRDVVEKILPKFSGAHGGGHKDAVGVRIKGEDLEAFELELENAVLEKL